MGVKNLALRGVALSEPPSASSSGSVIAFLDAPEGYEIELIQAGKTDG
jgi:lactoylglutathione lyase